jgi:hypothetical protein
MPAAPDSLAPDPAALGESMAHTMPLITGADTPPPPSSEPVPAAPTPEAVSAPSAPAASAAAPASVEVDAAGRPFDPAKHLRKKSVRTGLWLPKSPGRWHAPGKGAPKSPRPPSASPSSPNAAATASQPDLFGAPASSGSPSASASSPGASPGSPAGAGSYLPPEEELPPPPAAEPTAASAGTSEPGSQHEPVGGADDVAAVAVDLLSEGVGLVTGAPDEAEPSAKEGARLRSVLGAYLRSKGVETRGLWAVGLAFLAWLLRTSKKPKTREWVRAKVATSAGAQVIDIAPRASRPPEASATPAPAPAAPPPPADLPRPESGAPSYSLNLPGRR